MANKKRPRLSDDEFDVLQQYRRVRNQLNEEGTPLDMGWLKLKEGSFRFKVPKGEFSVRDFDFTSSFQNIEPIKIDNRLTTNKTTALFDRLVLTDIHIGMDASDKGRSLYDLSWTRDDIFATLTQIINFTIENQRSETLYIVDLGDFLDGFNAQTTRGGHSLQQNLTNQEAFDLGIKFKTVLIESLLPYYSKIVFHNINNDNHAGDFAYCLNSALKMYCEKAYLGKVEVVNQLKFIDYNIVGKYCFVTTHGKDSTHLKHGFKPKLDAVQINKIIGFLNSKNLLNQGYEIIFEKGDSHQCIFDSSSSDLFKYYNYPALSPSSNWVQTNFQKGKRGFVLFNYYENRKSVNEYFF